MPEYTWRSRGQVSDSGFFRAASDKAARGAVFNKLATSLTSARGFSAGRRAGPLVPMETRIEQALGLTTDIDLHNRDTGKDYHWDASSGWETEDVRSERVNREQREFHERQQRDEARGYRDWRGHKLPYGTLGTLHPIFTPSGKKPNGSTGFAYLSKVHDNGTMEATDGGPGTIIWPVSWNVQKRQFVTKGPARSYVNGQATEIPTGNGNGNGSDPMRPNPLSKTAQRRAAQRQRERTKRAAEFERARAALPPITQTEIVELVNNYHLARTALGGLAKPHERQKWAVDGFVREHPEFKGWEIVLLGELQEALQSRPVGNPAHRNPMKRSKAEVNYRSASGEQRCGNCRFFVPGVKRSFRGQCQLVEGSISADDVCDLWEGSMQTNPLKQGYSRSTISANIKKMMDEGRPQDQAVAASLSTARKAYRKRHPTGRLPEHLRRKSNPTRLLTDFEGKPMRTPSGSITRVYEVQERRSGQAVGMIGLHGDRTKNRYEAQPYDKRPDRDFPTRAKAEAYLLGVGETVKRNPSKRTDMARRNPASFACPGCGSAVKGGSPGPGTYTCQGCGSRFTVARS